MTSKIAFLFPGQGSQYVGMGREFSQEYPYIQELYNYSDGILSYVLSNIAWYGPDELLNDTINTQPAIFLHSIAVLKVLYKKYPGILPDAVAGHSMGELSALNAAGALSFDQGLRLAHSRGQLMKQAGELTPGGMAAVLGLDVPTIEELCLSASDHEDVVQVANDNCPGQVVISGTYTALDRVLPLLQEAGARRTVRLAVSIAAHSALMRQAQENFSQVVDTTPILDPSIPIIGNVTASVLSTAQDIRQDLCNQLTHRVRWTESIHQLQSLGILHYIEIGPGTVLSGLIKRIVPNASVLSLGTPQDFEKLDKIL